MVGRRLAGLRGKRYGETYAQAVEVTGYSSQTLRDSKWVSGQVEMSRRRDKLPWSHHREVVALDHPDQDRWLAEAEDQVWSAQRPGTQAQNHCADIKLRDMG